jgi:hypothetical protein
MNFQMPSNQTTAQTQSTFAVFAAFCKISSFLTEGSEESKGS